MHPEDPAFTLPTGAPAPVDPQIREFLKKMAADAAKYPRRDTVSIAEGRRIGEAVRAPWAQGGPEMADTQERYVPTRHGPVRIRIYTPRQRAMPGAFVYIHGGGFVLFSIDTHDRVMREYAERAGIVVIGIDYTRAPEARFPQPLEECVDVVRWVHAEAATLGIDPKQLFVGGDSAGGNLSMGTCLTLRDEGDTGLLRGAVLNYGAYSNNLFRNSVVRYGAGDYGLSLHMMIWFRGLHIGRGEDFYDRRYNILGDSLENLPPLFMVITECDPLYDDNIELDRRLRAIGADVESKVYPGTVHSFLEAVSIADVAVEAFDDTARWLRRKAG
ncbi:alpha/beta hydrolase fold domain-containing protein [Cupriavidus plantarum]|uniref:Acetyl esterase n=1 Tax=Cupriavidus plantarum TaxID=942865 RepID=A0A316EUM4_9BURK|nr:alpha/beta hydrolase fold domain-containing protein [Cupriavidus plantarum]PWK34869.1 acetyl esterase [Cupriavidus plantarum]RLK38742.1 acetyl esterase [Cupriavidus plantarum]